MMGEKNNARGKTILISKEIFCHEQYDRLLAKLAGVNSQASNTLLTYDYFTNRFSNIATISRDDLLYAIHVAYSWMPTMLHLFQIAEIANLEPLIPAINSLREIKTYDQLNALEDEAREQFTALSRVINNSAVGTSKVLHFFCPETIPIIDSRVVFAWNRFFSYYPAVILAGCKPVISPAKYLDYWKALLFWKEQAGLSSIRQLENPLFILGGSDPQAIP